MTYERVEESIDVLESENELLKELVKTQAKLIKQLGKKKNKQKNTTKKLQVEDLKEIQDLVTLLNVKYDRMEEFKDSQYKKDKVLTKRLDELEADLSSQIDYLINQRQTV